MGVSYSTKAPLALVAFQAPPLSESPALSMSVMSMGHVRSKGMNLQSSVQPLPPSHSSPASVSVTLSPQRVQSARQTESSSPLSAPASHRSPPSISPLPQGLPIEEISVELESGRVRYRAYCYYTTTFINIHVFNQCNIMHMIHSQMR